MHFCEIKNIPTANDHLSITNKGLTRLIFLERVLVLCYYHIFRNE
jgi:hypothetical protein